MITTGNLIVKFFSRNKTLVLLTFVACITGSLLNVLLPLSIGKFYELLFQEGSAKGKLFDTLRISVNTIPSFFSFFLLLIGLKSLFTYCEKLFTGMVGERFSRNLRELLFQTQLSHPLSVHERKPVGKYLLRYSGDLTFIQRFISKGVIQFSGDVVFLVTAFFVLYLINAPLTLMVLAGLLLAIIAIMLLNKSVKSATSKRRNQRSAMLGFVTTRLQAFSTIKSFNREVPEVAQYNKLSGRMYELSIRYYRIYALVQAMLPLLFFGTLAVVLYFVAIQLQAGSGVIHHADVLSFILLLLYIQTSIRRILSVNVIWQLGSVSFIKLLRIINLPAELRAEPETMVQINGKISFDHVAFQYPAATVPVLKKISFTIQPGTVTWLKGPQGAGKSTILKMIQGLYQPEEGTISIDDIDYSRLAPNAIRKNVTIISSETPLLGNTVFKAISYSRSAEKRDKAAQLLERIGFSITGNMNETLDFPLNDFASNISAGQRRQLMFARAILTRKKIMLIDDAFDDLDLQAKEILIQELQKLRSKRTIIIACNQLPAALSADQTINLNELNAVLKLVAK